MPRFPNELPVTVAFATSVPAALAATHDRPIAVVVPDRTDWNDFSRRFHAQLTVVLEGEERTAFRMRLMFEARDRTLDLIEELLDGAPAMQAPPQPARASVLEASDDYGRLVDLLGLRRAVSLLRTLGDAALAHSERIDPALITLIATEAFHEGALREPPTWEAFRNGARHLREGREADPEDAAHGFTMGVRLEGLPQPYAFQLTFAAAAELRGRACVLVGRNGTGKTRLMDSIVNGLLDQPDPERPTAGFDPPPRIARLVVLSSVATDPYPRELPCWLGLDYRYHSVIGDVSGTDAFGLALADCLRDDQHAGPLAAAGGRMAVLREALGPLRIRDELYVRIGPPGDGKENLHYVTEIDGERHAPILGVGGEQRKIDLVARMIAGAPPVVVIGGRVRALSSGETALLRFAAQAAASVIPASMLILDEPETHLHPNYISLLMAILDRILVSTRSVAIIATHSAYIEREVPTRRVRVLRRGEEEVSAEHPRLRTFGGSVDSISQFVFDDAQEDLPHLELLRAWVDEQPADLTAEVALERLGREIAPAAMAYVARIIRDRVAG